MLVWLLNYMQNVFMSRAWRQGCVEYNTKPGTGSKRPTRTTDYQKVRRIAYGK